MTMPNVGDKAPGFTLPDQDGEPVVLSKIKSKVVLYFYPKDDTPGCTIEAQGFRDAAAQFKKKGATVLGVSKDDTESHCAFIDKYGLNFTLLSDPGLDTIKAYGCWVEKSNYGKKSMGVQRATFLIENGKILKVWPNVTPDGHAKDVLAAL